MLTKIISSVIGTKNERELKRMRKIVEKINAYELSRDKKQKKKTLKKPPRRNLHFCVVRGRNKPKNPKF